MFSKAAELARSKLGGSASDPGSGHGFGTAPVFLASVSTILGAILFLRFGYAVAHVGLGLTLVVIALGHFVTIPTVLAVSEIATNRRVAGGGAYFIVSRSFGMSIGGAIGIALYLSQAISVAFYMVAFAEAFKPVYQLAAEAETIKWIDKVSDPRWVSLPFTCLLIALMLTRGANLGVRALWAVCCLLAAAIAAFLLGKPPDGTELNGLNVTARIDKNDGFGTVFAICFPAFTGMIAGLGLSGDLKNPQRSIPLGTIGATFAGMVIYTLVAVKLALSATPEDLAEDYFIMAKIAIWPPIIYIGLAAAALSSALGSIMVAPRTLQALARDNVLPIPKLNRLLEKGLGKAQEPFYATCVSGAIAIVFVVLGGVDTIARILTMFFMVTYGALCAVSFLEYFSGNPSYRPTFHTRWYLSLLGAVMCGLMMIRIDILYTILALLLMIAVYIGLRRSRHGQRDLTAIFQGTMFQLTRRLQIFLQKSRAISTKDGWRPSIVAVTRFGERRLGHFDLLRWICHRHGFGQFIQFSEGEYSFSSEVTARLGVDELIQRTEVSRAGIFVDSLICPSFQLAIAQTLQMPGVSGLPNNCILLEFHQDNPEEIKEVEQGARLAANAMFNVLILRSTKYRFGYRSSIHVWVTEETLSNAPMMLMFAYIIVGHPEWKRAEIKLFGCFDSTEAGREVNKLSTLMTEGRLPISTHNVTSVSCSLDELEEEVFHRSSQADLVIAGLKADSAEPRPVADALRHYERANEVLLVHSSEQISIR
ncbi:MAG: amino acid permease [Candidatus Poribacteria bacterium]|nr:amino acid permease [Candidatus Poribacteria bacterium]